MRLVVAALVLASTSHAQSVEWSRDFAIPGTATPVYVSSLTTSVVFDDGAGDALFVAGQLHAAGHAAADPIAKWNGHAWAAVPSSLGYFPFGQAPTIAALEVYDDGSGLELYAGGKFAAVDGVPANSIARWNGSTWQQVGPMLGSYSTITVLRVLDFGGGPVLCVGGDLTINGSTTTAVAQWNGASWSLIGTTVGGQVRDFAVFDTGSGPQLYVAGQQVTFPNTPLWSSVARFNGTTWENVGGALEGVVTALEVFDDGSGTALFAGGSFLNLGATPAQNFGKWDGSSWLAVGGGLGGVQYLEVDDLRVHDDGSGPALFVAGAFGSAGGAPAHDVARWDGASFSALGTPDGVWSDSSSPQAARAYSLAEFDAGNGPQLVVTGSFSRAGGRIAHSAARWDGAQWFALDDPGIELGANRTVNVLASYDDGNGPRLLAAGDFDALAAQASTGLAIFDGAQWTDFGLGAQREVTVAASLDVSGGDALYIGGSFETVDGQALPLLAKWDGAQWTGLVSSFLPNGGGVSTIAAYDSGSGAGPELYVGGWFTELDGVSARRIARWDGSAWHSVGATGANKTVQSLVVHDDGSGSKLYCGGAFLYMDGQAVFGIARWNGIAWEPVGNGFNSGVTQLAVFDDGTGPELYAAGTFTQALAVGAMRGIARWNGVAWQPVGSGVGVTGQISALQVFDDGSGDALYAGGGFSAIEGVAAQGLARWNGSRWSPVANFDGSVAALEVLDDGSGLGDALYVGGSFATVDGRPSVRIAKLGRSCAPVAYCTSGVTSNGCVPTISGSGTPSASATSGFTISVASVEGQKQGHVFYGINGAIAAPWGASSHFLCVKAPTQRTSTQDSGGTAGACNGSIALDWNNYIATHPGSLGVPFSAGTSVWAQLYFRDPPGPKTTALSNGLTFTVCP